MNIGTSTEGKRIMPIVTGIIRTEDGSPALGAVVRAFDVDLRSEQLLGESVIEETSGRYVISYTAEQYRRAEKKSADLVVRAFVDGTLRAESEVNYNAEDEERVDLTLGPLPEPPRRDLSELEELQEAIELVREEVSYRDFTDRDLVFLSHEATRQRPFPILERLERRTLHQRLEFLHQADQFAEQTGILLAAFYGWFRILDNRLFELDELLDLPTARLRRALEEAIAESIIPDILSQLDEILERLRSLRFERGRMARHHFVARLIGVFDDGTEQPLAGHLVDVVDLDAETGEQASGTVQTDGRGILVLTFTLPGDAPEDAVRRLGLTIRDGDATVAAIEIEVGDNQEEVADIRVQVREDERGDVDVEEVAPPELTARLRQRGIDTLHDLLVNPDVTDEDNPEGLEQLRGHARFAVLAPELGEDEREVLLEEGHRSLLDVAATSRAEFVREHHERLGGDAAVYLTREAAMAYRQMAQHMNASAWLQLTPGPGDEPDDPDIPTGVQETFKRLRTCGCKDCDSAVSPAAYLAHLLEWTLEHVKDVQAPITLSQLEDVFHQPFREMPASCKAVEEQVRQVRICAEVLWRFTGLRDLTELQMPTPFRRGYRFLRNQLYRQILTNLGVSFEQLRLAQLQLGGTLPAGEAAARQRETIAGLLGIDPSHLASLFFRIEQPPVSPSEADLGEIFGYEPTNRENLFEPVGRPDLIAWQQERLEEIWQQQDWLVDAYSGEARLPFVDPAIIDATYLRTIEPNPALGLLLARAETVADHRQALLDSAPQPDATDLVALLGGELGEPIAVLRAHYETLQAAVGPEEIAQAHADIAVLGLTPAGFTHLMETDAHLQNGEPIAPTDEEVAAAWDAVLDVLSRAVRHRLFPDWVVEEDDAGLILGSELFWLPVEPPAEPNPWQASIAERTAWEDALRQRSRRPVIDPDQIRPIHIRIFRLIQLSFHPGIPQFELPPLDVYELWQERRQWVDDDRLAPLRLARQNSDSHLDALQAVMEASTVGVGLELFEELSALEAEGGDLPPRLAQLNLSLRAYRFLSDIHQLAQEESTNIAPHEWQQVDAILVQAEKERKYAEWRLEEQAADIFLRPRHFNLLKEPPAEDDDPQQRWLHDGRAYEEWEATLRARYEQFDTLRDALESAVGDAEAQVLPLLRNLLIMHATAAPGDSFAEKAAWLDKRLLIDPYMDGCHMTTRISQAIETLQRFIRGIYTQEHIFEMQPWILDTVEDYEAEWPVLGSYATWRAYMLAYLYPENLLQMSPPSKQSYGFTQLKKKLPGSPNPAQACEAAEAYSEYFRDVCHLEVQASCQVETRVEREQGYESATSAFQSRVHLFALAKTSGRVYTTSFSGYFDAKDTLGTWQPVPKLINVLEIISAVPHETPKQQRLILLFAKVRQESSNQLMVVPFDLDAPSWNKKPFELDLPPGTGFDFSAVAMQKRHGTSGPSGETLGIAPTVGSASQKKMPTLLVVRAPNGRVYRRSLNASATGWAGDGWIPLFGPLLAEQFAQLCALIQRSSHEYLMIVRAHDGWLKYRIFSVEPVISKDDGFWRKIANGEFAGAFSWPDTPDIFVYYRSGGTTDYAIIRSTGELFLQGLDGTTRKSISEFDDWLQDTAGVSLAGFEMDVSVTRSFMPRPNTKEDCQTAEEDSLGSANRPLGPREDVEFSYRGNLLDLLTLSEDEWEDRDRVPPGKCFVVVQGETFRFLQSKGLKAFADTIAQIDDFQGSLGEWKFADFYVKQFALDGKGLAAAIEDAFDGKPTVFRARISITEISIIKAKFVGINTKDQWHFIPSGGDEEIKPTPRKAIALRTLDGAFRLKLQRAGDVLSAPKLRHVTPNGNGPSDLGPLSAKDDLQVRRAEIEAFYDGLKGSPLSVMGYLKEAYNLVPLYLGHALQRSGRYEEALLWYRQVFDYFLPFDKGKIDYSLRHEEKLAYEFDDAQEWLNDTSNPHAVAATRKNTYTRHVLLMIIRCLIGYGDRLFSHDNVTDNARARELYTTALKLLDLDLLRLGKSRCSDIIGELEVEVVEPGHLPLDQFKVALAQIQDPDRLGDVVDSLQAISQDTARPPARRLRAMRETVTTALAELPAPAPMEKVLDDKRELQRTLENHYLAHRPARALLQKSVAQRRQASLSNLAIVTDMTEETLLRERPALPWLRRERSEATGDGNGLDRSNNLVLFNPNASPRLAVLRQIRNALPLQSLAVERRSSFAVNSGLTFAFCIPQNPVITALRTRAQNNLTKLRQCRNIAGMVRQLDPYGAPIGIGAGMVSPDGTIFSGIVQAPPTPYRYTALIARAKELVSIAQQIEAGYQAALENAEREALSALQAEQSVKQAGARLTLQDLRLNQANSEFGLAQLQKGSAVLREETYAGWIAAGKNEHESNLLRAYRDAGEAQQAANVFRTVGQMAAAAAAGVESAINSLGANVFFRAVQGFAARDEGIATGFAINAQTRAQVQSFEASFERRNDEWQLQQGLAALDVQIGDQQIQLARDGIDISQQERVIAGLEQAHAADVLEFLLNKDFTEEMYRWIASVLEEVYRFFLQIATSTTHLAQAQLEFERPQGRLGVIQGGYWDAPADDSGMTLTGDNTDRLGLTGSARLLKDIYRLDQYAFETRQRKQSLTVTLDLAERFAAEFQRFRETGVLVFETPMSLIERQMPGYYLCLIQQVSVSVVALIPPTYGIRAMLTSAGISRAVVGGDTFQMVTIRNLPERIALTSPTTTSGVIELEPDAQSLLRPFEGSGFDTLWELRMPKAANPFDYNTMATVLFTVELTAVHSFDYERQVIEQMDRRISANRAFYFRQEFADAWYDLHNPEQTATPMTVRFETRRADFPTNLEQLRIEHVLLYFIGAGGEFDEMEVEQFSFTEHQSSGAVGGSATSVDGVVSTRRGNGTSWLPMRGQPPVGTWELALPNTPEVRDRFANEEIKDILLVLTIGGETPAWPA